MLFLITENTEFTESTERKILIIDFRDFSVSVTKILERLGGKAAW